MMKGKLLIAALSLFLVASCDDSKTSDAKDQDRAFLAGNVTRVHDRDMGVTCWTHGSSSISCLRDADIKIPAPSPAPVIVDDSWYEKHPFGVVEQDFPQDGEARHVASGPGK